MRPAGDFNPDADAKALRKAMKGLGKGHLKGVRLASGALEGSGSAMGPAGARAEASDWSLQGDEDFICLESPALWNLWLPEV